MTEHTPGGLIRGTLADLRTLMSHPVGIRRGNTYLVKPTSPAAGAGFTYKVDSAWYERIIAITFGFAASAAAANREVVLNYQDADAFTFTQVPALSLVIASQTVSAFGDLEGITPVTSAESASNYGTVTSPAAGANIVQVTGLPPGSYQVAWTVELGGTITAGTDNDNFKLASGGVQLARSVNPAVAGQYPQLPYDIDLLSSVAIAVQALALATVGAIYSATLTITPLSAAGAQLLLPDMLLKPSWQLVISVTNIQAGDQLSAIGIMTERYPSNWADGSLEADLEQLLGQ